MRKILMFFAGLILLGLTFVTLYFSGALFDATNNRYINAFVFQPNNLSVDRIGRPIPVDELSDEFIRKRLIKKFIIEYFYATPDVEDIAQRTRSNSVLSAMATPLVFKEWVNGEAKDIETLAGYKSLRTVTVADEIIPQGDYWEVRYRLKTWDTPNDMDLEPRFEDGIVYIKISFEKGIRDQINGQDFNVNKYLKDGKDPAVIFKFKVEEVRR